MRFYCCVSVTDVTVAVAVALALACVTNVTVVTVVANVVLVIDIYREAVAGSVRCRCVGETCSVAVCVDTQTRVVQRLTKTLKRRIEINSIIDSLLLLNSINIDTHILYTYSPFASWHLVNTPDM